MLLRRLPTDILMTMLLLTAIVSSSRAETIGSLVINDDVEIEIRQFGDPAATAIIWFACNQGEDSVEFETARKLAGKGYRTYFPDMLSAHFLSQLPSNIARVPADEVAAVVLHILQHSNANQIYLVAGARAAVPVLRGLADKRMQQASARLKGALLITPRINQKTPEPGAEPVYIDAVGLSVHPLLVLEGERTPNRWGLPHLSAALAKSGSKVRAELIQGVRGYFYLRDDQTDAEAEMTRNLDLLIHDNLEKLGSL